MISVVMPCYKEPKEFFVEALESILTQTYKDIEVIVIMNGYNPVLVELLEDYSKKDTRLSFYVNDKNRGIAYSLNRGIALANGEYIARMDSDDIAKRDRLEKELVYLQTHNLDLVGCYFEIIDEKGTLKGYREGPTSNAEIYNELAKRDCIGHSTWLFKKEVYNRVQGYAELLYGEDYHFLLKACKVGIKFGMLPEYCLKYRIRSSSESHTKEAEFYATAQFLLEHYDDIFEVAPDDLKSYLYSSSGRMVINEAECYFDLLKRFSVAGLGRFWYGGRLLMLAPGRKALKEKVKRWLTVRMH